MRFTLLFIIKLFKTLNLAILLSMNSKLSLILTLLTPLLLLSCSGKRVQTFPSIVENHILSGNTEQTLPSIGRPIFLPNSTENTPPKQRRPRPQTGQTTPQTSRPNTHQTSKYGESHYLKKFKLPNVIRESSGLIKVDNRLWTLNDSGGKPILYQINERNGQIAKQLKITNAYNRDWEDIAYDDNYVYIGDIGNNRGNRKDLKVYKIPRASLRTAKSARAEVIYFNYSDQKEFKSKPQKNNYDCEAMVAHNGKIYLFSKNWKDYKTRLYELSTQAGKHTAKHISTFNIGGMVTGATINEELDILLLTTYSSLLNVNVWAFSNYSGNNFFNGNKKQLNFKYPLQGQIEGVTFTGNYKAYLSSEAFSRYIFSFDASLYKLDFSGEFE